MSTKWNSLPHRGETGLVGPVVAKMRKTPYPENRLGVESKNRLQQYRHNISVTRGLDSTVRDDAVLSLINGYALDKTDVSKQLKYLSNLVDDDGFRFSRNLKIYTKISDSMNGFADLDHTSFRWNRNYIKSLEQLKTRFSKLRLKPLSYACDQDVALALPKTDTHSGYYWIESGKKQKGENIEGIYSSFLRAKDLAVENGTFGRPILIGFRTQASGEYDDDGNATGKCKHKTRVVSMVDLLVIIAELMFAKPLQKVLSEMSFYAGGKQPTQISSLILNWRIKFSKFLSIDYSSFDQSVSSWLIQDAFDVVRSAFVLNQEQSEVFDVIVHDFIHKDFLLKEGILHSNKGVPSGSMFTQIIDSIVNVIVVSTYFNSIGQAVEMIAMGDDNAIFTNSDTDLDKLGSYIRKNFGMIVNVDKSSSGDTKRDDVEFLSRYWRYDGQWRHPHQLLSRLAYPERKREYSGDVKPEHVVFAFILTYPLGMQKLIHVPKFMQDFPISKKFVLENVDSRYLPGSLAYIREYT